MKSFGVRDASGWTMFVFGLLALLLGLLGILRPEFLLSILGLSQPGGATRATGDHTLAFTIASAMASFNVGAYYVLAALNDMKKFYLWTVPFRGLTFAVFGIAALTRLAPAPFFGLAAWEAAGAAATGLALYFDNQRTRMKG
jgi:uncharacterized membrane protein HdeD (DUF308 family)